LRSPTKEIQLTFEPEDVTVGYDPAEPLARVDTVEILDGIWTRAIEGVCGIVLAGAFGTIKTWV
jgi:hypothetical protein